MMMMMMMMMLHGKYPQLVKQADVDHDKKHLASRQKLRDLSSLPKIKASQLAGTTTTSSRSLTWTQNADCVAVSEGPLTIWSLAALNWLKLNTYTANTRQLHTCTGRSSKSLVLR